MAARYGISTGEGSGGTGAGSGTWKTPDSMNQTDMDWYYARMVAMGMNCVRLGMPADSTNRQLAITRAIAAGLHVNLIIRGASFNESEPTIVGPIVSKYTQLGVTDFELGNECNIGGHPFSTIGDVQSYISGWRSRHNSNYTTAHNNAGGVPIRVLTAGMAAWTGGGYGGFASGGVDGVYFIDYALSLGDVLAEGFAYHPYIYGANQTADWILGQVTTNQYSGWASMVGGTGGTWTNNLRSRLVARGKGSVPIFVTEVGAPTQRYGYTGITDSEQAGLISKAIGYWDSYVKAGWAGDFYWYSMLDNGGNSDQGNFGVYFMNNNTIPFATSNFTAKAAVASATTAIAATGSTGGGGGGTGTGGSIGVRSYQSISAIGSTSMTVSAPAGMIDGDQIQLFVSTTVGITVTPPSGFTQIAHQTSHSADGLTAYNEIYLYAKTASSEPSSYTFTTSASGNIGCLAVAIQGTDTGSLYFDIIAVEETSAASTLTVPSVANASGGLLITYAYQGNKTTLTFPVAMTKQGTDVFVDTGNVNTSRTFALAQQTLATAGTTGTRVITDTNSNSAVLDDRMVGVSISFAPVATGGGTSSSRTVILSGNEITDVIRAAAVEGDSRTAPDSSMGVWRATTNLLPLGSAETGPNASNDGFRVSAGSIAPVTFPEIVTFGTKAIDQQLPATGDMLYLTATGTAGDRALVTAGTVYTFKIFEMAGSAGGEKVALGIQWFNAAGTFQSGTILSTSQSADITLVQGTVGAPRQPYRLTATAPAGAVSAVPIVLNRTSPSANIHFQVDGAQFEAQPYATPFKAGTRPAAQIQVPVASSITPTKGAFAFRVRPGWANNEVATGFRPIFKWLKDSTNDLAAWFDFPASRWSGERVAAGSASQINSAAQTFAAGSTHLIVFAWDATTLYLSVNGAAFTTLGNTFIPTGLQNTTNVLYDTNGPVQFDGDILWMMETANVPTSGELTTLNTLGNTDPTLTTLTTASPQLVWTASTSQALTFGVHHRRKKKGAG